MVLCLNFYLTSSILITNKGTGRWSSWLWSIEEEESTKWSKQKTLDESIILFIVCESMPFLFIWFVYLLDSNLFIPSPFTEWGIKRNMHKRNILKSAYNSTAFHNYIGNTMLNSKNKVNCRTIFRSPSTQCGMFPDSIPNSWWRCFYEYRVYHKTVFTLSYVYCLVVVQTTAKKEWRQFCETPRWFVFCIMSISK